MTGRSYDVSISIKAEEDLRNIADYVARERSIDVAIALVDSILEKIDTLERFPNRGSIPEEVRAFGEIDFRQIFNGPYRIFYLFGEAHVTITMIADGRRDIFSLLKHRLTSNIT